MLCRDSGRPRAGRPRVGSKPPAPVAHLRGGAERLDKCPHGGDEEPLSVDRLDEQPRDTSYPEHNVSSHDLLAVLRAFCCRAHPRRLSPTRRRAATRRQTPLSRSPRRYLLDENPPHGRFPTSPARRRGLHYVNCSGVGSRGAADRGIGPPNAYAPTFVRAEAPWALPALVSCKAASRVRPWG